MRRFCKRQPNTTFSWCSTVQISPRVASAPGPTSWFAKPSEEWSPAPCRNAPGTKPFCPSRAFWRGRLTTPLCYSTTAAAIRSWPTKSPASLSSRPLCLRFAANPQSILSNPAVDVIKSVPPVWDETIVLPYSAIGELAAYGARKGNTWFLAIMCGPQAKTIRVPLSFLGEAQYNGVLVHDSPTDDVKVEIEKSTHKRSNSLTIELRAGGGFLARFSE